MFLDTPLILQVGKSLCLLRQQPDLQPMLRHSKLQSPCFSLLSAVMGDMVYLSHLDLVPLSEKDDIAAQIWLEQKFKRVAIFFLDSYGNP